TTRITDPASVTTHLKPRRNRGVRCIRLGAVSLCHVLSVPRFPGRNAARADVNQGVLRPAKRHYTTSLCLILCVRKRDSEGFRQRRQRSRRQSECEWYYLSVHYRTVHLTRIRLPLCVVASEHAAACAECDDDKRANGKGKSHHPLSRPTTKLTDRPQLINENPRLQGKSPGAIGGSVQRLSLDHVGVMATMECWSY